MLAMSHMARAVLKRPCMDYKASFEHSKLERVKLSQSYVDGSTKTKKCPCFSGEHGIECLLYVEDRFCNIARQLDYTTGCELFDNFEEVLVDTAEEKWENLVSVVPEAQRTVNWVDEEMKKFYLHFVDNEERDAMTKYLPTCKKARETEQHTHSDQMETLI